MYTEEPRRSIDWTSVLKKGILVVIFALLIFFIIWLFVKNNNNNNTNVNYDNGNNNNGIINNTNAYSRDFIDNYRYFHDTAKEYFLISELPDNGSTVKYTLQQLIDRNLILNFSYGNNGSCDTEASYVTVTNSNGKYHMTTTLVCGTEVAKTTEELGCNQLCIGGGCTVEVVNPEDLTMEYRYKQAYTANETVYSCPAGYTKTTSGKNTICVKGDSTTVPATKVTTYNCPAGYDKTTSGDKVICSKDATKTTKPIEIVSYECEKGYDKVGDGSSAKCVKENAKTLKPDTRYTYSCPSDATSQTGSGENLKCYKETPKQVDAESYCKTGTKSGNSCVVKGSDTLLTTVKSANYGCPAGYSKYSGSGSSLRCYRLSNAAYYNYYSYPHGTTYNGCTYSGIVKQSCGSNCTKTVYAYYCKANYAYKNGVVSSYNYSCPAGTSYSTGSGASLKCYKSGSSSTTSLSYRCASGKLNGTKCDITEKVEVSVIKTSENYCKDSNAIYDKDANVCRITDKTTVNATKKTTKTCPDGFNDNGNGVCISTGKDTQNAIKHTEYKCEAGYTKFGSGSASQCTKGQTTTAEPSKSTKQVTKYRYKWSPEESLPGWERTGETRQVSGKPVK